MKNIKYNLASDSWGDDEIKAIHQVIKSNRYTMGPKVKEFENQFAEYFNSKYALMVNSGSTANLLMVASLILSKDHDLNRVIEEQYKKKAFKGLIHCFTGTSEIVKKLLPYNFYFSLSGIITFKNSENLRKSVKTIPITNMLVETDSPYLAPVPMRGKANEPSFIIHTVEYLSNLINVSVDELSIKTTQNFFKLFNKAK